MKRKNPPATGVTNALAVILAAAMLGGCASLPTDFEQPQVALRSIGLRSVNGLISDFDIVLNVINPNREALSVEGLVYTIRLSGYRLAEGVASDIPRIPAYGEAEVELSARADLLAGLGVLSELLAQPSTPLEYEFDAGLDLGGFYPPVKIRRSGTIALGAEP